MQERAVQTSSQERYHEDSEHANTIGCSRKVLCVSLIQILFIELFIVTFINFLQGYVFNIVVLQSVNIFV